MEYRRISAAVSAFVLAIAVFAGAGCADPGEKEKTHPHTLSFLKADGSLVKNAEGEEVILRGVNAGGLGVIEQWMTGFSYSEGEDGSVCLDHLTTTQVFLDRFGVEGALAAWENYRMNWWTDEDFENCAAMGMNVIRLPFTYMNVDFGAVAGEAYGGGYDFTFLEDFVDRAEAHGLYTILDMHGAYGSQNGQDHSGQQFGAENNDGDGASSQVTFYSNETLISKTAALWKAIAEHFKDNPAVAGYDILNEPGEKGGTTTKKHWDVFDRIYRAIREADTGHMVIFESCWTGSDLPKPSDYGWENCMYSFHHYTGTSDFDAHTESFLARLDEVESQQFGVPLYMGEFTAYSNEESWRYTLDLMNRRGWHWTIWTYKIWGGSAWGIYNIQAEDSERVNAHEDDLSAIRKKFRNVLTSNARIYTFRSGNTLYDIISEALKSGKDTAGEGIS